MKPITENNIEQYTIDELKTLGFQYVHGVVISPDGDNAERNAYDDIILKQRLLTAITKLNPDVPANACNQALNEVIRIGSPDLLNNNEAFHRFLTEGVTVTYSKNGEEKNDIVSLIDFDNPLNNEFLVVNQYTIIEKNQ